MKKSTQKLKKITRVLFGRTAFVIIAILMQFAFFFILINWLYRYSVLIHLLFVLLGMFVVIHIFNEDTNSAFKMAWIIPVLIIPIFGTMIYVFVNLQLGTKIMRSRLASIDKQLHEKAKTSDAVLEKLESELHGERGLASYLHNAGDFPAYYDNDIEFFPLGEFKFEEMKKQLMAAEKFIFMEYFIVTDSYMWRSILDILKLKASQGVEVRFMYDGMCSLALLPYGYYKELENMGIKVIMLTGDNEKTAKAIGNKAGVDQVIAGVLPQGKESTIRELTEYGNTVMVGDGINDAPALTRANIGMAIGAGTDVAIDAADVVLMKSNLKDVPAAIRLSKAVLRNIHENLFWAFIYNIIGIPLAAGIWYPIFGWKLNPMFGAAAMSLSSFCVVTNALRLNLVNIYNNKKDRKIKNSITEVIGNNDLSNNLDNKESEKETNTMEKTMKITGMMCGHCEATVKKALEALEQVDEAIVSHEEGTAVVKLNSDISNDVLKKTVEDKDYTVNDIIG